MDPRIVIDIMPPIMRFEGGSHQSDVYIVEAALIMPLMRTVVFVLRAAAKRIRLSH